MTIRERKLNRREALAGVGLVGAAALAAMVPATALADDGSDVSNGLEGAWLVQVTPDPGTTIAPHQVLTLNTKGGGVAVASDNPPTTGSPGFGAWKSIADNQHLETFELFTFDAAGNFAGMLRIRTQSSLDETRNRRTGAAKIDFRPVGSPTFITDVGSTHFIGTRMAALPL